jgi:hypothetical protein
MISPYIARPKKKLGILRRLEFPKGAEGFNIPPLLYVLFLLNEMAHSSLALFTKKKVLAYCR